jgi:hypothetical protein
MMTGPVSCRNLMRAPSRYRAQSDCAVGNHEVAVQAHAEIDRVRLGTFAQGLRHFENHGLLDKCVVTWLNHFSVSTSPSRRNIPVIVAGNPGGASSTGQFLQLLPNDGSAFGGERLVGDLLTTLARALGVDVQIGTTDRVIEEMLA